MQIFDAIGQMIHILFAWTKRHFVATITVLLFGMIVIDSLFRIKFFALLSSCWGMWYAFLSEDLDENEWQNWKK